MNPARMRRAPSGPVRQTSSQSWARGDGAEQRQPRPHVGAPPDRRPRAAPARRRRPAAARRAGSMRWAAMSAAALAANASASWALSRRLGLGQQLAHLVDQRAGRRCGHRSAVRGSSHRRDHERQVVGQRGELVDARCRRRPRRVHDRRARRRQHVVDALRRRPAGRWPGGPVRRARRIGRRRRATAHAAVDPAGDGARRGHRAPGIVVEVADDERRRAAPAGAREHDAASRAARGRRRGARGGRRAAASGPPRVDRDVDPDPSPPVPERRPAQHERRGRRTSRCG